MTSWSDIEKGKVDKTVPIDVERRGMTDEQWKSSLSTELFKSGSPLPFSRCIFQVPQVLRRQKPEAYEPDIVSIGPFHRGDEKFQLVENVKKWYFRCLIWRKRGKRLSLEELTLEELTESLDNYAQAIKRLKLDKRARDCYSDPCNHLDQNQFIEMLILDGCFLIELFRKATDQNLQDNDDPIFNVSCMLEYLYHDLMCLENQLPWFVLEFFYDEIERGNPNPLPLSLSEVVVNFFRDSMADPNIFSNPKPGSPDSTRHILDLIRTSLVQGYEKPKEVQKNEGPGLTLTSHLPQRIPSAATLKEAGVKFRKREQAECILNITFEKGVFTIPCLAIDERTDPFFRNLMAYEQCYHSCDHKITSYAVLMDNLIDSAKDVDLLCEKEIVANWLSADDASKFFNDLYNDTTVIDFAYKGLSTEVNEYRKSRWPRWKEILKRDYFATPWAIISFVAAFVLLVLTLLQTIFTVK